jgi:SAM-dependent methyltransferase
VTRNIIMPPVQTIPSVMRRLRAAGRLVRVRRSEPTERGSPKGPRADSWLELFDDELAPIEQASADAGPEVLALFRDLDDDLWALLLTQEYDRYPNIRALLPGVPEPWFQELWNGASGVALAAQSKIFYAKLKDRYGTYSNRLLADSRVLDFGCGWGRLTRYLARDVEPGRLCGCDPVEGILDVCRDNGVPATLAKSDFVPERLPFDGEFDLAFAFSVFTHISEAAHESCLRALHESLRPDGILVVTVRPPEYLSHSARQALESLGPDPAAWRAEPRYLFVPHPPDPRHFQYEGGEMTYGETVVTLPYVRARWSPLFELLEVDLLVGDLYQVMLTLRRR